MKRGDWNYRVFQHDNDEVEIVEVIYDGEQMSWCEMFPLKAENFNDLIRVWGWLALAFDKPTLNRTSFHMEHCCEEHGAPPPPMTDDERRAMHKAKQRLIERIKKKPDPT